MYWKMYGKYMENIWKIWKMYASSDVNIYDDVLRAIFTQLFLQFFFYAWELRYFF